MSRTEIRHSLFLPLILGGILLLVIEGIKPGTLVHFPLVIGQIARLKHGIVRSFVNTITQAQVTLDTSEFSRTDRSGDFEFLFTGGIPWCRSLFSIGVACPLGRSLASSQERSGPFFPPPRPPRLDMS